jgi:hypothetical protein
MPSITSTKYTPKIELPTSQPSVHLIKEKGKARFSKIPTQHMSDFIIAVKKRNLQYEASERDNCGIKAY